MKLSYFSDTDTLLIMFNQAEVVDSKDLDENTLVELDVNGNLVAITLEHASVRADLKNLVVTGLAA